MYVFFIIILLCLPLSLVPLFLYYLGVTLVIWVVLWVGSKQEGKKGMKCKKEAEGGGGGDGWSDGENDPRTVKWIRQGMGWA